MNDTKPVPGDAIRIDHPGDRQHGRTGTLVEVDGTRYAVEIGGRQHVYYGHGVVKRA